MVAQKELFSDSARRWGASLLGHRFPADVLTNIDGVNVVVIDMYVDLTQIMVHLGTENKTWETLTIYADQVRVPSEYNGNPFVFQLVGKTCTIYAREIYCPQPSGSFLAYSNQFTFTCYARHITGGLYMFHIFQTNVLSINSGNAGVRVATNSVDEITDVKSIPRSELAFAKPLFWILHAAFNVARQLIRSHSSLAQDMLSWIIDITVGVSDFSELRSQSYVLHARSLQVSKDVHFVPYLTEAVYKNTAVQYLDIAKDYEDSFNQFEHSLDDTEQRLLFANAMLKSSAASKTYLDSLLHLSLKALDRAKKRKDDALDDVNEQRKAVESARGTFQIGVEEYKKQQEREAILQIITAVVTVAASVASIAAGNIGGAASAGAAVAGMAQAAESAQSAAKAASAMSKVVKVMEKLEKLFEVFEKLQTSYDAIKEATDAFEVANTHIDVSLPDQLTSDEELNEADWEVFILNVESMMEFAVSEGIDGASDYQRELKTLAIRSQAYVKLTSAVAEAENAYLRDLLARKNQDKTNDIVKDLQKNLLMNAHQNKMEQLLLWGQLLGFREWAITLINQQIQAFVYWALDVSTTRLEGEAKDDVMTLKARMANVERARITALTSFNPRPQNFYDITVDVGNYPGFLSNMHDYGKANYTVSLDEPAFRNYGRVRVSSIKVLINQGAVEDPVDPYVVLIKTSGTYLDRDASNTTFSFAGRIVKLGYSQHTDGRVVYGTEHSNADDDSGVDYFQPTVFTTWEVNATDIPDDNLDIKNITDVKLQFSGEAIILTN